jgi:hypothetical protein
MEFGASLSGNCDLWVVSGEGKADFKVKLVWSKSACRIVAGNEPATSI